jgi:predicted nucleic acid-binding protein
MILEAQSRGFVGSNPARALGQKRELIQRLSVYADDVRNLLGGGLQIETVEPEDFLVALELQMRHGLLTNDSLNLAVAQRQGINEIATADSNFDHVQGLGIYKPEDLIR